MRILSILMAAVLLLSISDSYAFSRQGDAGFSVFIGEGQMRDWRFHWGKSSTIDLGLNISNGPNLYLGSRGWKDGLYVGGGPTYLSYLGIYGVVGYEGEFGPLRLLAEFWAVAADNQVVSALAHIGVGLAW